MDLLIQSNLAQVTTQYAKIHWVTYKNLSTGSLFPEKVWTHLHFETDSLNAISKLQYE